MYRVGVIGCRGIGNRHAQGAESLEKRRGRGRLRSRAGATRRIRRAVQGD